MKKWSKSWSASKKRNKQRKYVYQAPLHVKHKFLGSALSKTLKQRLGKRSLPVRTGDSVKITTGEFKNITGKVTRVDMGRQLVFVEKVMKKKTDGSEIAVGIHPSNIRIMELGSDDRKRLKRLRTNRKEKSEKEKKEEKK